MLSDLANELMPFYLAVKVQYLPLLFSYNFWYSHLCVLHIILTIVIQHSATAFFIFSLIIFEAYFNGPQN